MNLKTKYMDDDFFLPNEAARVLYNNYAAKTPVCDFHCHLDPEDIALDRTYRNLTRIWLGGDHYKWRLMRAGGVPEAYITGDAPDYEKFVKFAEVMPKAAGNPVHQWAHLELRRYFDCDLAINGQNARDIWEAAGEKLPGLTAREIIRRSNVRVAATTDDPSDNLEWHEIIANDASFDVKVVPTFRPDRLLLSGLDKNYLEERAEYFHKRGCRASDHGLARVPSAEEAEVWLFLGGLYKRLGWVMQIHYGAARGVNTRMGGRLGPDTGFDCVGPAGSGRELARFMDLLDREGCLPKTTWYSLDPNDNAMIGSVLACFEGARHGPAWWFNDSKDGIGRHLTSLANNSLLGDFIGMTTDSRSLLSYTRHEYFRRILCGLLGRWAEDGTVPYDEAALGRLVQDISYNNAMRYFGF
jgi:glucuronate isomerase